MLAPRKQFLEELLEPLRWVDDIRRNQPDLLGYRGHWPSSVTQFVVGAVGENDLELLHTTDYLYRKLHLRRAYFSPFNPIPDTPLENQPPESVKREHRLYEASFLLRDYGFNLEELPFEGDGHLPLDTDPKLAWAQTNLSETPIELNRASRSQLLRVPGIGPKSVDAHPCRVAGRTNSAPWSTCARSASTLLVSPPSSSWTAKDPPTSFHLP